MDKEDYKICCELCELCDLCELPLRSLLSSLFLCMALQRTVKDYKFDCEPCDLGERTFKTLTKHRVCHIYIKYTKKNHMYLLSLRCTEQCFVPIGDGPLIFVETRCLT